MNKHEKLKPNETSEVADENLMVNDAGIQIETKEVLEKTVPDAEEDREALNVELKETGVEDGATKITGEKLKVSNESPGAETQRGREEMPGPGLNGVKLVQLGSWIQGCKVAPGPRARPKVESATVELQGTRETSYQVPVTGVELKVDREGAGQVQPSKVELEAAREGAGQVQPARVELEAAREGAGQVQPARVELEVAREGAGQVQPARVEL